MSEKAEGRVPPYNEIAERAVLGSMMLNAECAASGVAALSPDDFYFPLHRIAFESMQRLLAAGQPVDIVTVITDMENQTVMAPESTGYIAALTSDVISVANMDRHIGMIRDKSLLRKAIGIGQDLLNACWECHGDAVPLLSEAGDRILNLAAGQDDRGPVSLRDANITVYTELNAIVKNGSGFMGITTGFPAMDRMLSGLQKGQLIVIAGRPGMGKTSFALNIAQHAGVIGRQTCLIFSLEMSSTSLALRILCSEAHVDMQRARSGKLGTEDFTRIADAVTVLAPVNIWIDDKTDSSVAEMTARARQIKHKCGGLDLIVVDYLQLMGDGRNPNRVLEIAGITRALKVLAKDLDVPVVLLSQLSRAGDRDGRAPKLTDLRDSGSIEQDADVVLFLQRDDYAPEDQTEENRGRGRIIIAKQRNGPVGSIDVHWDGEYTRYREIDSQHGEAV